ncbi:MAG: UDP-N-acetylmuramoyl-L-alanyl-D-glutamate--2,6-diaminopimelate ligase [Candidatus Omnitrophota bacterium]
MINQHKRIYLDELLTHIGVMTGSHDLHVEVSGVHMDSRKIQPGNCFVAIQGYKENGLKYIGDAIAKGAGSVVFEANPEDTFPVIPRGIPWARIDNARLALSRMAAEFYGRPADALYNIGITGTNGKTTVMSLIHAILNRSALTAKIGTLGMSCDALSGKTGLTTPESLDIFQFLAEAREQGCQNLVMEVSSVSLKLCRVADIPFSQAIFTSFSGDHLDFHHTMDDYLQSKLMLFKNMGAPHWAIVNIDDQAADTVLKHSECRCLTYGFSEQADVRPLEYTFSLDGIRAVLQTPRGPIAIQSRMVGRVNLSNLMAAVASAVVKGIDTETIVQAIGEFLPVRGRLDVTVKDDFFVLIDYAHTDNALELLLQSLREIAPRRIILVFGAGGSRDTTKRPRMGRVASRHADVVVVTSDNPRAEEPLDIIQAIIAGFEPGFNRYRIETDRRQAIEAALRMAQKGDLVVIAGKGHEDYQIFKDQTIHFDDYEVVRDVMHILKQEPHA